MRKADSGKKVWCTVSLEVFHCDQKERWDSFIPLTKVLKLFLFSPETWSEERERSPDIGLRLKCLGSICGDDALCFALCKAIGHNQLTNSIKALSVCLNKTESSGNIISRLPINIHFKKMKTLHLTFFIIMKYMLNRCLTEIDQYKEILVFYRYSFAILHFSVNNA